MYHYGPLRDRLAHETASRISLSYEEIEKLLGRKLPPSARSAHRRQWWANTESHSQAKAWLSVGRRAKPLGPELIEFYRSVTEAQTPAGASTIIQLDALAPATRRAIADLREEQGLSGSEAVVALLNRQACEQRRARLAWFQANTKASDVSSVDLVRAERDGR